MPARLDTPNGRKIVELSLAGKTYHEIAAELGLSKSYVLVVRWLARKAGIDIPDDPLRRTGEKIQEARRAKAEEIIAKIAEARPVRPEKVEGNEKWRALSDE